MIADGWPGRFVRSCASGEIDASVRSVLLSPLLWITTWVVTGERHFGFWCTRRARRGLAVAGVVSPPDAERVGPRPDGERAT